MQEQAQVLTDAEASDASGTRWQKDNDTKWTPVHRQKPSGFECDRVPFKVAPTQKVRVSVYGAWVDTPKVPP